MNPIAVMLRLVVPFVLLLAPSVVFGEEVTSVSAFTPRKIAAFDPAIRDPLSTESMRTYAVQVAAKLDLSTAESERTRFEEFGYSPVWIDTHTVWKRVLIGRFSTYVQALLVKTALKENGHSADAFIQILPTEEQQAAVTNSAPLQSVFALERNPFHADTLSFSFDNDASPIKEGGQRVKSEIRPPADKSVAADDEAIAARLAGPNLDSWSVQVAMDRAKARCMESDGLLQSRALLKPIAEGCAPATPQQRYEAMWQLARVYHAAGWRFAAFRAYSDLTGICQNKADSARAHCERVGLVLEMVESGRGSYADVRQAAAEALAQIPKSPVQCRKMRAVIELMSIEILYYEKQFKVASAEIEKYLAEYGNSSECRRETNLMTIWQAQTFREIGRREEALAIFRATIDAKIPSSDCFPNMSVDALAAIFLCEMALDNLDTAEADKWIAYLAARHPDRPDSRNLSLMKQQRLEHAAWLSRRNQQ